MSQGVDLLGLTGGGPNEPNFETVLRGYDRRQVDKYLKQIELEIAALAGERDEAYAQLNVLNQHLQQMQHELASARRFVATGDSVTYRHLGPRVEQILSLAEEQADAI